MNIIEKAKRVLLMCPGSKASKIWNVPVWAYLAFAAYLTFCAFSNGLVKASDLVGDMGQYMQRNPSDNRQMREVKFHYNNNVYMNQANNDRQSAWNNTTDTLNRISDNIRSTPKIHYVRERTLTND